MSVLTAFTDGATRLANPGTGSCAFVVYQDGGEFHSEGFFLGANVSNNFCEYSGLIKLLEWAQLTNTLSMLIHCDSQLVVRQVNCEWSVSEAMRELCARAFYLLQQGGHKLIWVRGHEGNPGNERADRICNEVLDQNGIIAPSKVKKNSKRERKNEK